MVILTPHYARVDAFKWVWAQFYSTRELGPETVRLLLHDHPDIRKKDGRTRAFSFLKQVVGGRHDGELVVPGFTLDLEQLRTAFDSVAALTWSSLGLDSDEGPYVSVEGQFQGREIFLRVLTQFPEDEEPGLKFDTNRRHGEKG
jgi:hypothetical protein